MPAVDSAQTRRVAPIGIAPRGSVRARISRRSQPSILPAAAHRLANRVIGTPYTLYELRRSVIPIAFAIACRTTSASPASTIQPDHTVMDASAARGATTADARLDASSGVTDRKHGTNIYTRTARATSNMLFIAITLCYF